MGCYLHHTKLTREHHIRRLKLGQVVVGVHGGYTFTAASFSRVRAMHLWTSDGEDCVELTTRDGILADIIPRAVIHGIHEADAIVHARVVSGRIEGGSTEGIFEDDATEARDLTAVVGKKPVYGFPEIVNHQIHGFDLVLIVESEDARLSQVVIRQQITSGPRVVYVEVEIYGNRNLVSLHKQLVDHNLLDLRTSGPHLSVEIFDDTIFGREFAQRVHSTDGVSIDEVPYSAVGLAGDELAHDYLGRRKHQRVVQRRDDSGQ